MKNQNFDPIAWAGAQGDARKVESRKPSTFNESDVEKEISLVVNRIVAAGIDLTNDYNDWLRLGFALVDALGEGGREHFHHLSSLCPKYEPKACDRQYDACLHGQGGGVTIATFFHMAKEAGVDIGEVSREVGVCATSARVPCGTMGENNVKKGVFDDNDVIVPSGTLAQVAQSTFSDHLRRDDLPSYLWPVWDNETDAVSRDKMLLGTLNVISGLLPSSIYSLYDRRKIYAPLYNFIYGRFATSKGDLEAVKHIADPIKREMRRKYDDDKAAYDEEMLKWENLPKKERGPQPVEPVLHSPFVYANSSAAVVYRDLDANGGWGVMFETEADSLSNMLSKSEYGDYSDLLRKAHHHESCPYKRITEHINIELEAPRLSIFLTGTGSQLPLLLPAGNVSNGLASRFLFYALPDSTLVFRNVFAQSDKPMEDVYKDLGSAFMPLYHALLRRADHPIQFMLSHTQQQRFISTFQEVLTEQAGMLGVGINGFILRIALECFRYAMVLTALRRLSELNECESLFDDDEQALICDERDFKTAMTIINCLVNHTGRVYSFVFDKDDDPFNKPGLTPSKQLQDFYHALPSNREFNSIEAKQIASGLNISQRTMYRLLGEMVDKFQVLNHPSQGVYAKAPQSSSID